MLARQLRKKIRTIEERWVVERRLRVIAEQSANDANARLERLCEIVGPIRELPDGLTLTDVEDMNLGRMLKIRVVLGLPLEVQRAATPAPTFDEILRGPVGE